MPTQPRERKSDVVSQYLVAGATGGVGRMVDKAATRGVTRAAEKYAGRLKEKREKNRALEKQNDIQPEKKLAGAGFVIMLGFAIMKDVLDIFFAFTIFFAIIASLFGLIIMFVIFFYYVYNDVKWTIRKIATVLVALVVEFIPFINAFFPATTIHLFLVKKFENNDMLKKFAEKSGGLLAKV